MKKSLLKFIFIFAAFVSFVLVLSTQSLADEEKFVNHLGMEFVKIKPGVFIMGSPADEPFRDNDEVQHKVIIKEPFYIQATEVTIGQWRKVMGKRLLVRKKGAPDMPVVKVSYFDCLKFIKKLNKQNKGIYRLPTEEEWEFSCRAGSENAYTWGEMLDCQQAMFGNNKKKNPGCIDQVMSKKIKINQPAPVKTFSPNAWGLYDMHGNVWEWCQDPYHDYLDPSGSRVSTEEIKTKSRVRRGGSWYGKGNSCRSANRTYAHPGSKFKTTGFRLVVEVP